MVSSGLLRRMALVRTEVSEEPGASFIRVTKIGELGTTQVATNNRRSLRRNTITSIWNKEEMPDQWKESIIVAIHKTGDKTDCNNYRGIALTSTSYKILSNILLSRLSPYIDEIIGDHQYGCRRNRSTTDHIFCIRYILEKVGVK
jgi:hypothetical protein